MFKKDLFSKEVKEACACKLSNFFDGVKNLFRKLKTNKDVELSNEAIFASILLYYKNEKFQEIKQFSNHGEKLLQLHDVFERTFFLYL